MLVIRNLPRVLLLILLLLFLGIFSSSLSSYASVIHAEIVESLKVTITYPDAKQEVPVGNLTIYGTSSDDASRSCHILILLNDDKPYQSALATGPEGKDDYSRWTFTFDPYSSLIKQGKNEIVSKIVCIPQGVTNSNNNLPASYNKINVTGSSGIYQQTDSSSSSSGSSNGPAINQILPPELVETPTNTPAYEELTQNDIANRNVTTVASPDAGATSISNVVPSIRTDNDIDIPDDKPSISNNTLFNKTKSPPPSSNITIQPDQKTMAVDTSTTLSIVTDPTPEDFETLRDSVNGSLEALYDNDLVAALQYLNEADNQLFKITSDLRSSVS
jgi:hypothetical protein